MEAKKNWEDIMYSIPALLAIKPGTLGRLSIAPSSWDVPEVDCVEP
jgi:hypothetical protein